MPDDGNFLDGRLHALGNLDYALESWVTGHHAFEKIAEDPFDLAVDQIIDLEFVQAFGPLQLPGAGSANDYLRPVFRDDWMLNDLQKLGRVYGDKILARDLGINIGRIGNAQRIVRVDSDYFSFRSDEFLQVFQITNDDVFFRILA